MWSSSFPTCRPITVYVGSERRSLSSAGSTAAELTPDQLEIPSDPNLPDLIG